MLIINGHLRIIEAMDEQLGVVELLPDGFVQRVIELRDDVAHLHLVCPPVLHRVQRHRRGRHGEAQLAPVCAGLQLEAGAGRGGLQGVAAVGGEAEADLLRLAEAGQHLGLDPLPHHLVVAGGVPLGGVAVERCDTRPLTGEVKLIRDL